MKTPLERTHNPEVAGSTPAPATQSPQAVEEQLEWIRLVALSRIGTQGVIDGFDEHEHICGTSGPLALGAIESLAVVIDSALGALIPCPNAATTGTVVATFTRR